MIWACLAPLALYQWALIARTGQSLGKRWTRIKIFKKDGSDVDFVSGVVMRNWILFFIPSLFTLVVPEVPIANLVGFVDAVMIFGVAHRCLHDYIAGTQVLQLQRGGF